MSRVNILQCVINVGFVNNEFFSWFRVAKRVTTLPLLEDPWSVIRPVAFFENVDDATNFNPLTKGKLKFLTYPDKKVKFIACEDIGKGSAVLLTNPKEYGGKTIEAAGSEHTALDVTTALSDVSGTVCNYAMAMPRSVLWLLMGDLYHMITWMETVGYSASIEEFKKLVPDAQDAKAFFERKGQWANGEKFVSS